LRHAIRDMGFVARTSHGSSRLTTPPRLRKREALDHRLADYGQTHSSTWPSERFPYSRKTSPQDENHDQRHHVSKLETRQPSRRKQTQNFCYSEPWLQTSARWDTSSRWSSERYTCIGLCLWIDGVQGRSRVTSAVGWHVALNMVFLSEEF
jgi:hypothetical protein